MRRLLEERNAVIKGLAENREHEKPGAQPV
jgi:hypothetical protein